jgi:hypothetical protein
LTFTTCRFRCACRSFPGTRRFPMITVTVSFKPDGCLPELLAQLTRLLAGVETQIGFGCASGCNSCGRRTHQDQALPAFSLNIVVLRQGRTTAHKGARYAFLDARTDVLYHSCMRFSTSPSPTLFTILLAYQCSSIFRDLRIRITTPNAPTCCWLSMQGSGYLTIRLSLHVLFDPHLNYSRGAPAMRGHGPAV